MRFFFDRCVPISLARMVRGAHSVRHTIIHQDEYPDQFPQNMADVGWIAMLGNDPPWIIISGDGRILKNKVERQALESVKLPAFFMDGHWNDIPFNERAWRFMKVWHMIVKDAATPPAKNPFFTVLGWSQIRTKPIAR